MQDYNFWRDLFDTYQSLSDGVQIVWMVVISLSNLGLLGFILHYRLASKRIKHTLVDERQMLTAEVMQEPEVSKRADFQPAIRITEREIDEMLLEDLRRREGRE